MRSAGLRAFEKRSDDKTGVYSFEQRRTAKLPPAYVRQFKASPAAWDFFSRQPPGYQRVASFYVLQAKQEETRQRRLQRLIGDSAHQRRIGLLQRKQRT